MARDKFNAGIQITVTDRASAMVDRIERRFGKLEQAGKKAGRAFDMGNLEEVSRGAVGLIEKPLKKFADFEEQMDSVAAATFDLTKALDPAGVVAMNEKVAELSATARKLGADTRYSATEAAIGMDILAKNFAGSDMEKAQAVIDAMPGILATASATKESIEAAADVSTATMNQFGLSAKDMGKIGDVLVKTANGSATGLLDLGEALKYSGVTAKNAGVDLETTLGMIAALGNAGKKGSVAGTGLASVLGNVQSGAKKQKSALAALGININDKKGNLKPIVELLADMEKAADKKFGKGKGGVRRDRWLQGLVGMGGDKEALAILMKQAGTGELQALVEANKNAEGTAQLVATAMNSNANGAARELDSALEELQLTIGETLVPTLKDALLWLKETTASVTTWAKENPELTKVLGVLAVALGIVATATRAVTLAMATNPIVAIATAIGAAAYLIYDNWEAVSGFFKDNWEAVAVAFAPIMPLLAPFIGLAQVIMENWEPIKAFFSGLWDGVAAGFTAAMEWILGKIEWASNKIDEMSSFLEVPTQDIGSQMAGIAAGAAAANSGQYQDPAGTVDVEAALRSAFADWIPQGPAAAPSVAVGAPLMGPDQAVAGGASRFDGQLKITVNGGAVSTEMTQKGDPGFEVRVNKGSQAA